jgi:hypothetical protein
LLFVGDLAFYSFHGKEVRSFDTDALNKFRQNKGGITLLNFIKLMRGIGELDRIEALFADVEKVSRQRIRKPDKAKKLKWGDE